MSAVVLDASVFVAAVSPNEIHHERARELYASHPRDEAFLVPSLFRIEVLSAFARRGESGELLDTVEAVVSGPRFHTVAVDELLDRAAGIVRVARLRAYDAIYAALCLASDASLMTLDTELGQRFKAAFPEARLSS